MGRRYGRSISVQNAIVPSLEPVVYSNQSREGSSAVPGTQKYNHPLPGHPYPTVWYSPNHHSPYDSRTCASPSSGYATLNLSPLYPYSLWPKTGQAYVPGADHTPTEGVVSTLTITTDAFGGITSARLVEDLLRRAAEWGCIEVSVTTLAGQQGAINFYRARGFGGDAVLLEKHLGRGAQGPADDSQGRPMAGDT